MTTKAKQSESFNAGDITVKLEPSKIKFTKEQWLTSKQFTDSSRDLINTLLEDGESYSIDEVNQKFEEFKAKEVK
ncbi:hypothetical protein [Paenibacillus sp. ACRRY]|uniref:hypothetical protein n=1 Tax=Paenibacillus sp. ACRRY TaxID=2918208 RepID=UPI001EF6C705|nr:hypothetical protein [Paenibacillus sp. ACRRY]MCG7385104.1 hypothetical protein [Paenibacillus sp. ACRRY]